jgi:hypothetical protein
MHFMLSVYVYVHVHDHVDVDVDGLLFIADKNKFTVHEFRARINTNFFVLIRGYPRMSPDQRSLRKSRTGKIRTDPSFRLRAPR